MRYLKLYKGEGDPEALLAIKQVGGYPDFCTVGGSGAVSSTFIYVSDHYKGHHGHVALSK